MPKASRASAKTQRGYNTNLASEFYVMSVLYRLGFDANLTLGNKKAVDIVVVHSPGRTITIDVKALAGRVDWLVGNAVQRPHKAQFVVLLAYDGKFGQIGELPKALGTASHGVPCSDSNGQATFDHAACTSK